MTGNKKPAFLPLAIKRLPFHITIHQCPALRIAFRSLCFIAAADQSLHKVWLCSDRNSKSRLARKQPHLDRRCPSIQLATASRTRLLCQLRTRDSHPSGSCDGPSSHPERASKNTDPRWHLHQVLASTATSLVVRVSVSGSSAPKVVKLWATRASARASKNHKRRNKPLLRRPSCQNTAYSLSSASVPE